MSLSVCASLFGLHGTLGVLAVVIIAVGATAIFASMGGE